MTSSPLPAKAYAVRMLLLFLAAFGAQLWLFREVWQAYQPANDDIALILHSTSYGDLPLGERIRSWFTEGFANYWYVFPDWSVSHTNYLRPGVNLSFLLLYTVLGTHWAYYLVACYAMYSLVLLVTVDLAYRSYHITGWPLVLVVTTLATTPAAWLRGELFFNPTFAFDAVVTAQIIFAFQAYLRRNYVWLTLLLLAALFTKETALAAAAAACSGVLLRALRMRSPLQGIKLAIIIGSPAAIWLLLRWLAFGSEVGVAVASNEAKSPLFHYARSFLEWPFNAGMINQAAVGLLRQKAFLDIPLGFYLQLGANLAFLLITALTLRRFGGGRNVGSSSQEGKSLTFDTLFWLGWLWLLVVLNSVTPRIGEVLPVLAACLIGQQLIASPLPSMRQLAAAILLTVAASNLWTCWNLIQGNYPQTNAERSRNQRALFALIREQARPDRELLVINDFSSRYASNNDLRSFAKVPGTLLRVASIEYVDDSLVGHRPPADFPPQAVQVRHEGGDVIMDVQLPDYLQFKFEDTRNDRILATRDGDELVTKSCRYRFADLQVSPNDDIGFGRRLSVRCKADDNARVIFYDVVQQRYRVAEDAGASP